MIELAKIDVSLHYEIIGSEVFNGKVGYTRDKWKGVRKIENLTDDFISRAMIHQARIFGVPVENVRLITKEWYELNVEDRVIINGRTSDRVS